MERKYPQAVLAKIVVVDDEHIIADTVALILQKHGFDATAVYSGRAALACCETVEPQLVITDVMMPDMNGVETALRVQQKHPLCKVLLFSGQATGQLLAQDAYKQGQRFELMLKPMAPGELVDKVAECLGISPSPRIRRRE